MKKIKIYHKNKIFKIIRLINYLALCMVVYSANVTCDWLYYQEEEPNIVKKLRKF